MMKKNNFVFLDPGRLIDSDLELVLIDKKPAIDEIKKIINDKIMI